MNTRPVITIFGSSAPRDGEPAYETARRLGELIAGRGWTVCNGGYGGTMEASARGAIEAGGRTIGVTCRAFGRSGPNRFLSEEAPTDTLVKRLETLVDRGDAFVILPGGTGTLLELALVWELANKGLLERPRPIVTLGEFWTPLVELIRTEQRDALVPLHAKTPEEAVGVLGNALDHVVRLKG